jgi:hypothetical protein
MMSAAATAATVTTPAVTAAIKSAALMPTAGIAVMR